MIRNKHRQRQAEIGSGIMEYGLTLSLIGLMAIIALAMVGFSLQGLFMGLVNRMMQMVSLMTGGAAG